MAVPTRPIAALGLLGLLAACGANIVSGPGRPSPPAGTWTTTITAADDPPSPRLVDDYRLELHDNGLYELTGAGFTASGQYLVDGDSLELSDDTRCAPDAVGRYEWAGTDDGGLELTADGQDPCDRPTGGREFVLTTHPWTPAG